MHEVTNLEEWLNHIVAGEQECTTPYGAVSSLGALYVKEMLEIAREEDPNHTAILWADCGADSGAALAAIRNRLPHITFHGEEAAYIKFQDMAKQAGLVIRKGG